MSTDIEQQIEQTEKEIEQLMERRRSLLRDWAGESVEDYTFAVADGSEVRLSELFGDKEDLIAVHNMGKSCPYCTLWADGFNGVIDHLSDRAGFVVISPDPADEQKSFAEGRNWQFRMVSAHGSSFTDDMGYQSEQDGKTWYWPGVSIFHREADGTVRRVARDFFGPGDPYAGIWHLFELLPDGPNGWQPRFGY